jgi:hypothetical protein
LLCEIVQGWSRTRQRPIPLRHRRSNSSLPRRPGTCNRESRSGSPWSAASNLHVYATSQTRRRYDGRFCIHGAGRHLRRVNLIERQRDQRESEAVSCARAYAASCSAAPSLPPFVRRTPSRRAGNNEPVCIEGLPIATWALQPARCASPPASPVRRLSRRTELPCGLPLRRRRPRGAACPLVVPPSTLARSDRQSSTQGPSR